MSTRPGADDPSLPRQPADGRRAPVARRGLRLWRGALLACVLGSSASAGAAGRAAVPSLGTAQSFGVLAGSTVTNTGPTTISGDVGVSPGSAVTGFPPGQLLTGSIHAADAAALSAQAAATQTYNGLVGERCTQILSGQDLGGRTQTLSLRELGGLTLLPGVYCFATSALLNGTLTLDAQGDPSALFIFKIGSSLTVGSGASINLIGSASPCSVFWQVGSSATLGTGANFAGNLLALTDISINTGTTLTGRALALNGAVTLDGNAITAPCAVVTPICPTVNLTPPTAPNGTAGVAYSQLIAATGGAGPYGFSVAAGALPAGLTLAPSGLLSGTPTVAGAFSFDVRAVDANTCAGSLVYALVVASAPACPAITMAPASPPNGTIGAPYSQTIVGSGGAAPYVFTVAAGSLPTGLTLSPAGVLSGTPTAAGPFGFTVRAVDTNTCAGSLAYAVVVASAPGCAAITMTPASPPNGTIGTPYSQTVVGSGGTAPYVFTLVAGSLPTGLTLSPAGVLSGTPTSAASYTFTVRATDGAGCFAESASTVLIATAVPTLPQLFLLLLAVALTCVGYVRVRRLRQSGR